MDANEFVNTITNLVNEFVKENGENTTINRKDAVIKITTTETRTEDNSYHGSKRIYHFDWCMDDGFTKREYFDEFGHKCAQDGTPIIEMSRQYQN